jgi:hypothetical protein
VFVGGTWESKMAFASLMEHHRGPRPGSGWDEDGDGITVVRLSPRDDAEDTLTTIRRPALEVVETSDDEPTLDAEPSAHVARSEPEPAQQPDPAQENEPAQESAQEHEPSQAEGQQGNAREEEQAPPSRVQRRVAPAAVPATSDGASRGTRRWIALSFFSVAAGAALLVASARSRTLAPPAHRGLATMASQLHETAAPKPIAFAPPRLSLPTPSSAPAPTFVAPPQPAAPPALPAPPIAAAEEPPATMIPPPEPPLAIASAASVPAEQPVTPLEEIADDDDVYASDQPPPPATEEEVTP